MSRRSQATLSIRFLMKSRWNDLDLHVTRAGLVVRLPQFLMNKQERMIAGGFFSCGLQFTASRELLYCTTN